MQPEPDQLTDEELARRAAAGSSADFEPIALRWESRIHEFLVRRTHSPQDAEDLAQQVFISVWRNLGRFDPARRFGPWIYAVARRTLIDHWRAAARHPASGTDIETIVAADRRDPARAAELDDAEAGLWARVGKLLPAAHFEALWLHARGEFDVADIARAMGRTRTHVKVMLFRARRALIRAGLHEGAEAAALRDAAGTETPVLPTGVWNGGRPS